MKSTERMAHFSPTKWIFSDDYFFFHCVCEWQWLGQIFWLILCECLTFNWLRYFKGCLIDWKAFYVQTRLVTLMLGIEFTVTAQALWALAQGFLTNVDEFIDCLCSHWFMEFWHWSEEIATSFSLVFFQHFSFIFSSRWNEFMCSIV